MSKPSTDHTVLVTGICPEAVRNVSGIRPGRGRCYVFFGGAGFQGWWELIAIFHLPSWRT